MAYDAVTTTAAVAEMQARIAHGRVDKIIQPSALGVALTMRAGGGNHTLLLSAHAQDARATLTSAKLAKAFDEPSAFVMLLRKHLEGATLAAVAQAERDRIVRLTFRGAGRETTLVVEVMGKHSNIILVDDQDVILGAVKHITPALSRQRIVLPHQPYAPPPPPMRSGPGVGSPKLDPFVDGATIAAALDAWPRDAVFAAALVDTLMGLSPQAAREIAFRLCGDAAATMDATSSFFSAALVLVRTFLTHVDEQPSLARQADGKMLGWAVYALRQHEGQGVVLVSFPSVSALLDEVYDGAESGDALGSVKQALHATVKLQRDRLNSKAEALRRAVKPAAEIDRLRLEGEMVLAFAHEIAPGDMMLRLDDPPLAIALDPTLSAPENARKSFTRYRKMRDAALRNPPLIEEAEEGRRFLDEMLVFIDQADSPAVLKDLRDDLANSEFAPPGSKKPSKPTSSKGGAYHPGGKKAPAKNTAPSALRFTTSDGLQVLVGRSARQNEVVTFSLAAGGDLWFHARGLPGSHVVLKTAGTTPPARSIEQAASLAAYYSRGRENTTTPVDIVPIRQVKRAKGGKPGLVLISGETTVQVKPLAKPDDTR